MKHDGLEHHLDIPALEIPTCEKCGEELFDNRVDDQISDALRAKLRLLTPVQIRRARKALGLSQRELAERLKIASATISRWETGALIQSSAMDNYLRIFYAFPIVREALVGSGQAPELGVYVESESDLKQSTGRHSTSHSERADPSPRLPSRFPYAIEAHGEEHVRNVIADVSRFGFFVFGHN